VDARLLRAVVEHGDLLPEGIEHGEGGVAGSGERKVYPVFYMSILILLHATRFKLPHLTNVIFPALLILPASRR